MIRSSEKFDLGADKSRMKDRRDAQRQQATVNALLARLYGGNRNGGWPVQILADEVGMGKTYVALATAFSVLDHLKGNDDPDLRGCYRKVLIITPSNTALRNKWFQEVGEFVQRCVHPEERRAVRSWFSPVQVDALDELPAALSRRGRHSPAVVLTGMSVFGKSIRNFQLKRRVLLGVLFRYWGTRFPRDARRLLLKGAPSDWPSDPKALTITTERERQLLSFTGDELLASIEALDRSDSDGAPGPVEALLERCREAASRYNRRRSEQFQKIEWQLNSLYRAIAGQMIRQAIPLVIVDEAHNWKNGPKAGKNGFRGFEHHLAPKTRRLLMLTATPFQLDPHEMLELVRVGETIAPKQPNRDSPRGCDRLARWREEVLAPALTNAAKASKRLERQWSRLPATVTTGELAHIWSSDALCEARRELRRIAHLEGAVDEARIQPVVEPAVARLDPAVRAFFREALRLYTYNADLSREMGTLVIRHRRRPDHRLHRVGVEYEDDADRVARRPDRHVLHGAPGLDVRGEGELPHYLLMRFVSELKGGQGRTSLGSALTGCYSTLLHSAEGAKMLERSAGSPEAQVYLRLLRELVDESQDAQHPKVARVVERVVESWLAGEKTLIFCFRTNTARRLRGIINDRIREELQARKRTCLGGEGNLKNLRSQLTGRERGLAGVVLDRVLWSYAVAHEFSPDEVGYRREDLILRDRDIESIARLSLQCTTDPLGDRIDRVFLNRAVEHVLACRFLEERKPPDPARELLERVADPTWVRRPYAMERAAGRDGGTRGGEQRTAGDGPASRITPHPETVASDERGPLATYRLREAEPAPDAVARRVAELIERRRRTRQRGQTPVLDFYTEQPSLWLGPSPSELDGAPSDDPIRRVVTEIHRHLWALMESEAERSGDGDSNQADWSVRAAAFSALRRVLLRESVLLRLLPSRDEHGDTGWASLLVDAFYRPLPGQHESMADRMAVFLEDLQAASGSLAEEGSKRHALYDATRLRDQQFVALADGRVSSHDRSRIFTGFNTPLLPEILVCTSVGQEGIDLHRHCRHVVHYDLAWNPAVLEQRTGRIDRIGCKALRERSEHLPPHCGPFLEVAIPFLAGTYDERMYEELRLRAQIFEVLTGGDLAADSRRGADQADEDEGAEKNLRLVPMPDTMVHDLRVCLAVWHDASPSP